MLVICNWILALDNETSIELIFTWFLYALGKLYFTCTFTYLVWLSSSVVCPKQLGSAKRIAFSILCFWCPSRLWPWFSDSCNLLFSFSEYANYGCYISGCYRLRWTRYCKRRNHYLESWIPTVLDRDLGIQKRDTDILFKNTKFIG